MGEFECKSDRVSEGQGDRVRVRVRVRARVEIYICARTTARIRQDADKEHKKQDPKM